MAQERKPDWRYHRLVFVTARGNPYHGSEVLKAFRAALTKAGVRLKRADDGERRFHDLRHSTATQMRDEGTDEETRMARLGHSTTTMARHYGKASETQDRNAAERHGRALGGAG